VIVDALMESGWHGDPGRDEALHEAIHTTLGLEAFCAVLADQCSTETDERMATTTSVVRHCEKVCKTTMVALANWETADLGAMRAAVEACIGACEDTYADLQRYHLPELYPGSIVQRHELYDTLHRMRKTMTVVRECRIACEEFLEVWFGAEVPE
jgi:hypothetical protein